MKPELQRIAIAKACGFTLVRKLKTIGGYRMVGQLGQCERDVPDYLNDLNAMHEAEKIIPGHRQVEYWHHLFDITRKHQRSTLAPTVIYMVNATAAQRAEAFLRTLAWWQEQTISEIVVDEIGNTPCIAIPR